MLQNLRRSFYEWKAYFTKRTPPLTRWVFITPIGEIVIYSERPVTQAQAQSMLKHTANQITKAATVRWTS